MLQLQIPMPIQLKIAAADALAFQSDVLALKYAQQSYGVDALVIRRLAATGTDVGHKLPQSGSSLLVESSQAVAARDVLFIGVEPLGEFDYESIRSFSQSVLSTLTVQRPLVRSIALTLHGAGFGLDTAEAFRAEIAGILDAVAAGKAPQFLEEVTVVEIDPFIAKRLDDVLHQLLPSGVVDEPEQRGRSWQSARTGLSTVGHDSRQKPHVFVAMPFADEYADRFHYGIVSAVNAAGFLCERADLASYTGDVLAWVKDRIGSATLVIADLTRANPNVYLEVGYAWGRGIDTVLILAKGDELKFDVRTQRCLVFQSIRHLEELLAAELKALVATRKTRHMGMGH